MVAGRCRVCGTSLEGPVALGRLPAPRDLRERVHDQAVYAMSLAACSRCGTVQVKGGPGTRTLVATLDRPSLRSPAAVARVSREALDAAEGVRIGGSTTVLAVGATDGLILRAYRDAGARVLGIEPAPTRRAVARAAGVPTIAEPFGVELATQLAADGLRVDLLLARTVLGRVTDVTEVLAAARELLRPRGRLVVDLPPVAELLALRQPGRINPEWRTLLPISALRQSATQAGLVVEQVQRVLSRPLLRCRLRPGRFLSEAGQEHWEGGRIAELVVDYPGRLASWAASVHATVDRSREQGERVAARGASAETVTALNLSGLRQDAVEHVLDVNPFKQGLRVPGVGTPVVAHASLDPGDAGGITMLGADLTPVRHHSRRGVSQWC